MQRKPGKTLLTTANLYRISTEVGLAMQRSLVIPGAGALFTICLFAQFRAGIQGVISDPSGGVIPNANVTLTNNETQRIQKAQTSGDGFYSFSGLPPGTYSLTA